jgi:outer membrane protein OmpA-like peptidoglycan-associated protein
MLTRVFERKGRSNPEALKPLPRSKSSHEYFSSEIDTKAQAQRFSYGIGDLSIVSPTDERDIARQLQRPLQAKLEIGAVHDPLEREADQVADRVMRMRDVGSHSTPSKGAVLERECASCAEEDEKQEADVKLSRKESDGVAQHGSAAPPIVHEALRSPGQRLDPETRAFFEPRFRYDFSSVRVHADSKAAESARAVRARAYTVGSDLVFAPGQYSPGSSSGRRLIAHELAHVGQQQEGGRSGGRAGLQRQSADEKSPGATKGEDDKDKKEKEDEPTAWLTLQAQGLGQYSRVYTIPKPPPALLGAQLAANVQFHSGKKGFELGVLGQYGHIFKWRSEATAGGDQFQVALQPSYVFINTDSGSQIALIGQGGYASTSSTDASVAGKQFSLLGGLQYTQDLTALGPLKLQGVASVGAGYAWAKGPLDDKYSGSGTWQVAVGFQIALDTVKRKKKELPPPPDDVVVPVPDADRQEKHVEKPKPPADEQKKTDEGPKKQPTDEKKPDEAPKPNQPPPPPPLPQDLKIFFLQDKPRAGLPADRSVTSSMNGADLPTIKKQVEAALNDPNVRVVISGYASIEGPNSEYNCALGSRRAEWLRRELGISKSRVADPIDKATIAGNCVDDAGIVSFGSTQAEKTDSEARRQKDRFAIVHFYRQ